MVGHQYVGVQQILIPPAIHPVSAVTGLVVFAEETGLAIVSALDDMKRDAIKLDTGAARHTSMIRLKQITLSPLISDGLRSILAACEKCRPPFHLIWFAIKRSCHVRVALKAI